MSHPRRRTGGMLLPTRCPLCARPGPAPCPSCVAGLQPARAGPYPAVLAYAGDGRRLVHALKYRNGRAAARSLGAAMAELVGVGQVDVVTWAPTAGARRRARGYDQAEVLARAVALYLGVPCRRLLRRIGRAGPQTGRSRAERLGAGPTFVAARSPKGRVLVVDDVVTTGSTLHAATVALLTAGATALRAVAAAATP
jgi:predicted amidophosphoribosyltransferase